MIATPPGLNLLQDFMARGNVQTVSIVMEDIEMGGEIKSGTFGDAVMMPVMTQTGYEDHLVTPVKISRVQFASDPKAHQSLTRISTKRDMFIQIVDISNPVVYTLICTDRKL